MNHMAPGQSINRRYLHDEVAERLRELIRAGELEPRARVNELELAERFGISRTPLREAIKILATEGLLDLLPNRGARVASISMEEIEEMVEVVAGLEATAADLACRSITDQEIAAIEEKHRAMVEAWKRQDNTAYFTLNREIHEAIMQASRNATLQGIYANLSGRIQRARYQAHKTPAQWERAVREHDRMLELLRKRDGETLSGVMREHIRGKKAVISAAYG
ncbi:GntR family transcriptional regulator [Microvirga massiliensis]|uniref:GntR family transcriptional regulator n=1 Tax=Microvirga massiliensis TaxID=1033741 RepID=UPI00062BB77E|nr:GntR family transcriptional regulator [Microvirga massiliensis]